MFAQFLFLIGASVARADVPKLEINSPPSTAARRASIDQQASELWPAWEKLLALAPGKVTLRVSFQAPKDLGAGSALAGRTRGLNIELNDHLPAGNLQSVFAHELAHAFLTGNCPADQPSEFYSESFALWLSKDDQRLIASELPVARKFSLAASARDYLQARMSKQGPALSFHDTEPAHALARLIAESRRLRSAGQDSLLEYFSHAVSSCELEDDALSEVLTGVRLQTPLSQETVLIVDGLSGEVLRQRGAVDRQQPVASLLKPYLLSVWPGARVNLLSKNSAEWNCPFAKARDLWTWQKALALSCNGFFLDLPVAESGLWKSWSEPLRRLGILIPDENEMTLGRAIGLVPGVEASARQLASLFRWISLSNKTVADALVETARSGTLAKLPDSNWFVKHGIAMKSGTIRNQQNEPEHGWILAIGPRNSGGFPAFVAAIHQRGSSPQILLARLRAHLEETVGSQPLSPLPNPVQILSLVSRAAVRARCDGPWLHWIQAGRNPALTAPETIEVYKMKTGEARQCARGPIKISFPKQNAYEERDYWGRLVISSLAKVKTLPAATARQNRARSGSEMIIETSESNYLAGVLASEFPQGRAETLKALALVVKFNAAHSRHGDRPVCDTTHCQVFGPRNSDAEARPGARLSAIVRELGHSRISGARDGWLPFSLGGSEPWSREVTTAEIETKLKLPQTLHDVAIEENAVVVTMGETGQGLSRRIPCEKFRNSFHLLSCPLETAKTPVGWRFQGEGEGHGIGLDLRRADAMAVEGRTYAEILRVFYPGIKIEN